MCVNTEVALWPWNALFWTPISLPQTNLTCCVSIIFLGEDGSTAGAAWESQAPTQRQLQTQLWAQYLLLNYN